MNINTAIQNSTLTQLLPDIAQFATTKLSLLGKRTIQVPGYEGSAPIDALAAKVIQLVRAHGFEYTPQQRAFGEFVAEQINRIYTESDRQVDASNCFTKLICLVKSAFCGFMQFLWPSRTSLYVRWCWTDNNHYEPRGYREAFRYYTPRQYGETFGTAPERNEMDHVFGGYDFRDVNLAMGRHAWENAVNLGQIVHRGQDAVVDWNPLPGAANQARV